MNDDDVLRFMRMALEEGEKALLSNEVPVGCVIVRHGSVLTRGTLYP